VAHEPIKRCFGNTAIGLRGTHIVVLSLVETQVSHTAGLLTTEFIVSEQKLEEAIAVLGAVLMEQKIFVMVAVEMSPKSCA
jgi:hypothetical protein